MGRYIKKFSRVGSAGPTEERGFAIWAGYDIVGTDEDLSDLGLIRVTGWPDEQLEPYGVRSFLLVEPDDHETRTILGIERNDE